MNSLDHRLALALVSFFARRGDRIVTDLGTVRLQPDGDAVRHFLAHLEAADGSVRSFAVSLAVAGLR